jgi:hypothetical protein
MSPVSSVTARLSENVVASDLDEVLGQFLKSFISFYNSTHSTTFQFSDFTSYNFSTVLNRPYEEIQQVVFEYFHSPDFRDNYEPLPGAIEGYHELAEVADIQVVTARPAFTEADTLQFLTSHFNLHSSALHMGNHHPGPACSKPVRRKSEICQQIGAKVLIDDCLEYAIDCATNANIPVILFDWNGNYGWNKSSATTEPLHPLIKRVHSWTDVVDAVHDVLQSNDHTQHSGRRL